MKLAALGDSNTGNNNDPYYVTAAQTYFQLAANALGYSQAINAGKSGHTAQAMLARIQTDVIAHSPDVCLVMAGTNEAAGSLANGEAISSLCATYKTALDGIITALLNASIKPVIISPPYSLKGRIEGRLQKLRDTAEFVCLSRGVQFCDLYSRMKHDGENAPIATLHEWFLDIGGGTPDLYHLGVAGHQRIANFIVGSQMAIGVPEAPPTPTGTVLNAALSGNFGNIDGKTIKVRIKAAQLTPPAGDVTKIRLTLQAHADEPLTLAKCFIGKKNAVGDAYDAVSLASLKVVGATAFTIPQGGQATTDWLPFLWNKTDDLIVSLYCNGGASADKLPAAVSSAIGDTYLKNGDEAATANASGFTEYLGYLSLVTKIETDGFTG